MVTNWLPSLFNPSLTPPKHLPHTPSSQLLLYPYLNPKHYHLLPADSNSLGTLFHLGTPQPFFWYCGQKALFKSPYHLILFFWQGWGWLGGNCVVVSVTLNPVCRQSSQETESSLSTGDSQLILRSSVPGT